MYSSDPHWMPDATESCFPGQGHKRVPYSWSLDGVADWLHTFSKKSPHQS